MNSSYEALITDDSNNSYDERLNVYTFQSLSKSALPSMIASLALALIVVELTFQYVPKWLLGAWLSLLIVCFAIRLYLISFTPLTSQNNHTKSSNYASLNKLRLAVISSGYVWTLGLLAILYFVHGEFSYQQYAYLTFIMVSYFVGVLLSLYVDVTVMQMTAMPILFPLAVSFLEMGDLLAVSTASALLLALVFVYIMCLRQNQNLQESILLRFQAHENEKKFIEIINSSPIAACISDADSQQQLFLNARYKTLQRDYADAQTGGLLREQEFLKIKSELIKGRMVSDYLINLNKNKQKTNDRWVLASFNPFFFDNKPAVLSWYYDITDRKQLEEKVEKLAYQDQLTGLPNRILFNDRLQHAIKQADRENIKVAVMFIDLDGFKLVNDRYGHDIGDLLLAEVASCMKQQIREVDTIARLGGDEFGVIMLINDDVNVLSIAENIRNSIQKEIVINGKECRVSTSIGISLYPEQAKTAGNLLNYADQAMYGIKRQGKNNVAIYSD